MTADIQTLTDDCISHLAREESLLSSLQIVVETTRASLLSRSGDGFAELTELHSRVAVDMAAISRNRTQLRQRIAQAFSVPNTAATVGLLAARCDGPLRLALEDHRTRLKAAGENLNKWLIANSHLALQLLELVENVFRSLSGDQARSPRYERTGRPSVS